MIVCARRTAQVTWVLLVAALAVSGGIAYAATGATKDEAVAMVKKAVAAIKTEGPDKAYAEISNPSGPFVDRDLYIVVYGRTAWCSRTAPTRSVLPALSGADR